MTLDFFNILIHSSTCNFIQYLYGTIFLDFIANRLAHIPDHYYFPNLFVALQVSSPANQEVSVNPSTNKDRSTAKKIKGIDVLVASNGNHDAIAGCNENRSERFLLVASDLINSFWT